MNAWLAFVLLGLGFGSFVNALVWRLHKQENSKSNKDKGRYSITRGRSECVHCGHKLAARDLLPIVSWLSLRGRCRYCKKSISWQYPLVEASTAALFVGSWVFWPQPLNSLWQYAEFGVWLACIVGFVALIVYDLRWMLLPNKIIFPLLALASLAAVVEGLFIERSFAPILEAGIGVLIGGGLFYVLYLLSDGRWIGGGDVKLGFLLGALVGGPMPSILMLFLASLLGTLMVLPLVLRGKASGKTKIPFGPFLIVSAVIVMLFGQKIIDWYMNQFIVI
jgi:leader peptidase (prepilin peptidase) / N-methyltransferase